MKFLSYKGYTGSIEYSSEDQLLFGKIMGIQSLLSYEGHTGIGLESDFRSTIDDYLLDCKELNIAPEKPYKGSFNVRISPELHKELALEAINMKTSQNQLVSDAIKDFLVNLKSNTKKLKQNLT